VLAKEDGWEICKGRVGHLERRMGRFVLEGYAYKSKYRKGQSCT
jgi:hypothetical protein